MWYFQDYRGKFFDEWLRTVNKGCLMSVDLSKDRLSGYNI